MAGDIDAVIAALRIALEEAQKSGETFWTVKSANRWINQLPGAWAGRWRHLKLAPEYSHDGSIGRRAFIGHVRATLAYLEANREAIRSMRIWSWPLRRAKPQPVVEPIDAEFKDVMSVEKQLPKPRRSVRVIK
ncbi:MAG: hypothetical protein ACM31O_16765 [Bacteroidota bacterium]